MSGHSRSIQGLTGTALVCVRSRDPSFPPGQPQDYYVRFELPQGRFTPWARVRW